MPTGILLDQLSFVSWNREHLLWLGAGALSIVAWLYLGVRQTSDYNKRLVGLIMGLIPVVIWNLDSIRLAFVAPALELEDLLPFHLCYFLNLILPFMLWRRSLLLFEITYFMVMAGCFQALLTPDLQATFPSHLNIRYFVVHIGLVQSTLYAIVVYKFRPTLKGMGKAIIWANLYLAFVGGLNWLLGTNFMFLRRKPVSFTILDFFGQWPWYILQGEILGLLLYWVVYLPFWVPAKVRN
ncbi:MAG: TIGR02206 family membrane protein [Lewinellaceae bacterium]|nr:TIGR02206 family membrane protein [Lewinellaceae bacterium]